MAVGDMEYEYQSSSHVGLQKAQLPELTPKNLSAPKIFGH